MCFCPFWRFHLEIKTSFLSATQYSFLASGKNKQKTLIQCRFYCWKGFFCVSKPSRSGGGGKMVLPTRFMVAVKLYLHKCLRFVCKCHVGLFLGLSLSRYKHGKSLCITWTFSSFPQSAPFFSALTFSTFKLRQPLRLGTFSAVFFSFLFSFLAPSFYSFYLAQTVTTAHAGTLMHRVHSSSLLLWHWRLRARPSECWRHFHLMCTAESRRKEWGDGDGGGGRWWLCPPPSPPSSTTTSPPSVPFFSMTHHENKKCRTLKLSHSP